MAAEVRVAGVAAAGRRTLTLVTRTKLLPEVVAGVPAAAVLGAMETAAMGAMRATATAPWAVSAETMVPAALVVRGALALALRAGAATVDLGVSVVPVVQRGLARALVLVRRAPVAPDAGAVPVEAAMAEGGRGGRAVLTTLAVEAVEARGLWALPTHWLPMRVRADPTGVMVRLPLPTHCLRRTLRLCCQRPAPSQAILP